VDHLERITDTIESHRDLVDAALATYYSLISSRTTDTIRVLTVISTIFMPLTFLTGFFGMNVPLPYQNHNLSTVVIFAGLFGISGLMLMIFKNLRWL
jgi:magnesium transporter